MHEGKRVAIIAIEHVLAMLHLGVEQDLRPARKAHPALLVRDLPVLVERLRKAGVDVTEDALVGHFRVYIADPFGNRIELLEPYNRTCP
jgi:catechol 2,3-dioxygenase-like lactoylglutathione lyase family enzyme